MLRIDGLNRTTNVGDTRSKRTYQAMLLRVYAAEPTIRLVSTLLKGLV